MCLMCARKMKDCYMKNVSDVDIIYCDRLISASEFSTLYNGNSSLQEIVLFIVLRWEYLII